MKRIGIINLIFKAAYNIEKKNCKQNLNSFQSIVVKLKTQMNYNN